MPYTRSWDETSPAGSAQAATADDAIRALKEDIRERMNTILDAGGQWDDDPIALNVSGVGGRTNVEIMIPHEFIRPLDDDQDTQWRIDYFRSDNDQRGLYVPLSPFLPVNSILQSVRAMYDKQTASGIQMSLSYRLYQSGSASQITLAGPTVLSASGIVEAAVFSALNHTVLSNRNYFLELYSGSNNQVRLYGFKLIVDLPGLSAYV